MLTPLAPSKWNESTAAHLLNRAAFGGTPAEIEATRRKGLTLAVRDFVEVNADAANLPPPPWARPRNIQSQRMEIKTAKDRGENFQEKARPVSSVDAACAGLRQKSGSAIDRARSTTTIQIYPHRPAGVVVVPPVRYQ